MIKSACTRSGDVTLLDYRQRRTRAVLFNTDCRKSIHVGWLKKKTYGVLSCHRVAFHSHSFKVCALEDGVDEQCTTVTPYFEQAYFKGLSIPFRIMSRASGLLASVFGKQGNDDSGYHVRLMAALQSRAFLEKNDFVMFVTWARNKESERTIAGIVTLSKGLSASGASGYESEKFCGMSTYSICNMAVRQDLRRRGIARRLLSEVETYVRSIKKENEDAVLVLSVEKYSVEAQQLYTTCGYLIDVAWEDPRWLDSIERGRVDVSRRILMYKIVGKK